MRYSLGIDPDVTRPCIACVGEDLSIVAVDCIKAKIPKGVQKLDRLLWTIEAILNYLDSPEGPARWTSAEIAPSFLTVEGQGYWRSNSATPESILSLGFAAGLVLGAVSGSFPLAKRAIAVPHEWKGDAHKHITQARLCKRLGWEYTKKGNTNKTKYCVPAQPVVLHPQKSFNPGDWKHGLDAVGIAIHAFDEDAASLRRVVRAAVR